MRSRVVKSFASALLLSVLTAAAVHAADRLQFDLPPQALLDSLRAVGARTGTNVLASAPSISGLKAPALRGRMTIDEAFARLLAGSGLKHEFLDEKTVTFVAVNAAEARKTSAVAPGSASPSMRLVQADAAPGAATADEDRKPQVTRELTGEPEEVVVKGVKDTGVVNQGVIPRQANEALRYEIIDRAAIERSGATSLPELFRSISGNTGMGTNSQIALSAQMATGEGVRSINDTVDLRGLGSDQTLVMVNGRRLFGGENSGADLSRIPVEAIERIELLPTSGSAIYGANAVGGVVNIVLRKDYDGSQVTAYYGVASGGAAGEKRISFHNGMRLNEGRTSLSLLGEVESKDPLLMKDRRYYETALARIQPNNPFFPREIIRNFIGPQGTIMSGSGFFPPTLGLLIPADPTAPFAAIPAGAGGASLTPASFNGTTRTANLSTDRMDRATLIRGQDSYSLFGTAEHSMRDGRLGAYGELSWRYADTSTDSTIGVLTGLRFAANDPRNPFRTGVTPGYPGRAVFIFFDPVDLPRDTSTSYQRTLRAVGGLKGQLTLGEERLYNWAVDVSWDRNETYARNVSYSRNLSSAITAGLYDPFRDLAAAPPITGAALDPYAWQNIERTELEIGAVNWRVNGDLFRAWGGPSRFSLGLETRFENEHFTSQNIAGAYGNLPGAVFPSSLDERKPRRRAKAAYLEVVLPLVGEPNRLPMVRELEVVGAVRMEKYSDFGSASPPMAAIKYAPLRDLILRASYSEGFQPPSQSDLFRPVLNQPLTAGMFLFDPLRNGEEVDGGTYLSGGNPDLRPETSDTWDAGVVYSPAFVPGLSLSASYFRYDKFDVVGYPDPQDIIDYVPGRIVRGAPEAGDPPGMPGPIVSLNAAAINLARQFVDGWDFKVDYTRDIGGGRILGLTADATRTDRYLAQPLEAAPLVDRVGERGFITGGQGVLRWRGRTSLWIEAGNTTWTWNSRFFDSYGTDSTTPTPDTSNRTGVDGAKIPSSMEHDLVMSYSMGASPLEFFSNTRWTAGVLNIFDKAPPPVSTRISMWYSNYNDPRQRVFYLQMRKTF